VSQGTAAEEDRREGGRGPASILASLSAHPTLGGSVSLAPTPSPVCINRSRFSSLSAYPPNSHSRSPRGLLGRVRPTFGTYPSASGTGDVAPFPRCWSRPTAGADPLGKGVVDFRFGCGTVPIGAVRDRTGRMNRHDLAPPVTDNHGGVLPRERFISMWCLTVGRASRIVTCSGLSG